MPSSQKKDFRLALLVAAAVAASGLLPLAYHYGWSKRATLTETPVAVAPGTGSTAPATEPEPETAVASPPGTEVVPPEEAETDRGPASASPAGPTLSFGRAAGLHLAPDPLHLNSSAALVIDQDSGQVLAQKNDQVVLPIASLTKIMTALVVVEAKQPMDEVLTITEEDVDKERHSRSRLKVGSTLTRQQALHLALMSSENRAAHALGRTYPGGLPKMVEAMNAKARALGMNNTTYVDPTGLSNRNQSTARDMATLVAAAGKHPLIGDFSTTPAHVASLSGQTLQYRNSNRLVRNESGWDIALQKTGYIVEAGRCLSMLVNVAGHKLIMVLLDADTNGSRMADAQRLRRWVVAQNGWHDELMVAKAEAPRDRAAAKQRPDKAEKVASAKASKADRASARKAGGKAARTEVASARKGNKAASKDVASAGKGKGRKDVAVARKAEPKKAGRVSKTFAAARPEQKG